MSTSNRRLEANRANAKKSTGPKTPEGKAKCAKNSVRHGLCAASFVLESEDIEEYNDMRDSYVARFHPRDMVELNLIERMVHAAWNQHRSWTLQNETIDLEVFRMRGSLDREFAEIPDYTRTALAFEKIAEKPGFSLLQRYEARHANDFHRALKALHELRKNVPLAPPGPLATGCQTDPTSAPDTQPPSPDTEREAEKATAPPATVAKRPASPVAPSTETPTKRSPTPEPVEVMRANSVLTEQWSGA